MPERNPPWARDELILALDLYFRLMGPDKLPHGKPEVVELSRILKSLPIHTERPDLARFRNTSGVYMKLSNFLSLDRVIPERVWNGVVSWNSKFGENFTTAEMNCGNWRRRLGPDIPLPPQLLSPPKSRMKTTFLKAACCTGCTGHESATKI